MNKGQIISSIVERFKVRLDEDDPAFILVEMNRMALLDTCKAIVEELEPIPAKINEAAQQLLSQVEEQTKHQTDLAVEDASIRIAEEVSQARVTATQLIEDVARANRNVNASKWFAVAAGACIAVAAVAGGVGYWIAATQAESAAARAGQVLAGPEGAAAVKLAELGQARILLECKGPGWTEKDGSCYGTPVSPGKTVGWRTK
ncbi:hypothetical protein [Comamonas thiooxydans]|nr:hypothetical protein [Comamonas thiooxydans]